MEAARPRGRPPKPKAEAGVDVDDADGAGWTAWVEKRRAELAPYRPDDPGLTALVDEFFAAADRVTASLQEIASLDPEEQARFIEDYDNWRRRR